MGQQEESAQEAQHHEAQHGGPLQGAHGSNATRNAQGETQQKLDLIANAISRLTRGMRPPSPFAVASVLEPE